MMELYEKMNKYLADQQVMFIKLHNLHWYIEGNGFFTLHSKFEELYDQTAEIIDEVAERLLALGQCPVASTKKALSLTTVEELDDSCISAKDAIHQLTVDTQYWIKNTKEIVTLAEQSDDSVTADIFNGYLKEYQKLAWMLNAYSKE